jgi:hypothetical protein
MHTVGLKCWRSGDKKKLENTKRFLGSQRPVVTVSLLNVTAFFAGFATKIASFGNPVRVDFA